MARPSYTGRRHEALLIVRNANGMLEIGMGRVRIAPGAIPYFRRVTMSLACVLDLPGGPDAFARGDELGLPVTIMQLPERTVPPNAWTLPDDLRAGSAAGVPIGRSDGKGDQLTGSGTGCGSRIVFDPDDWPRQGDLDSSASHEVLLDLLLRANDYAAGSAMPPTMPPRIGVGPDQLRLSCRPSKVGDVLVFPYVVENMGPDDVYVMDAIACPDPKTGAVGARERCAVLIRPSGDVIAGTYVPPMPTDRQIAVPVIPLARRLAPGQALEHRLEIPAPYAETSPWLPDPTPQEQSSTGINGIVLAIGYWPAAMAGLVATEASYAPGLYAITPACGGARVSLRFPTTGLQFVRRTDAFAADMIATGTFATGTFATGTFARPLA
jgi:hypothetical protein